MRRFHEIYTYLVVLFDFSISRSVLSTCQAKVPQLQLHIGTAAVGVGRDHTVGCGQRRESKQLTSTSVATANNIFGSRVVGLLFILLIVAHLLQFRRNKEPILL